MLHQPTCLGRRLIGSQSQPFSLQDQAVDDGAKVLPSDGRAHGYPCLRIEDDRGCALIRDAAAVPPSSLVQSSRTQLEGEVRDLLGVKFHFARIGRREVEPLAVGVGDATLRIDDGGSNPRGADVNGKGSHHESPPRPSTPGFMMSRGSRTPFKSRKTSKAPPSAWDMNRARL